MNYPKCLKAVLFFLLMALASSAGAAIKGQSFSLSPYVGGYTFDGAQDLDTSPVVGARLGYELTRNFGIEGLVDYIPAETEGGADVAIWRYGLDALYHFNADGKFVPYVAAGYGGLFIDPDGADDNSKGIFNYGLGVKYFLTPGLALRADVRHLVVTDDDHYSNLEYTLGLYLPFGGAPAAVAAVAAAPLDSDGDGVVDTLDQCPGTGAGVKVDGKGCPVPLDSDGDGVLDSNDRCPGTAAGVKVDSNGCPIPLDSDKDGVTDDRDACPDTPSGSAVDSKGCPPPQEQLSMRLAIQFETGKAEIADEYAGELKKVGDFMLTYPTSTSVIEGHTDNQGDSAYNQTLSQQRADAVRTYLIDKFAIAPERLTAKGYGASRPIADNATADGRKQNRRIEANFATVIKK